MAQQTAEADGDRHNGRKEIPSSRVFVGNDETQKHTVLVSEADLHYLTEVAIADIDEYGSVRMILHGSLFGQSEVLASVFELAKAEYDHREESGARSSDKTRIRLSDDAVKAVLLTIREKEDYWGDLVAKGMENLGRRLSDQTGYERPV